MKIVVVFVVILMSFSCQGIEPVPKPDNLITKETMGDILYDMAIITSARGHNSQAFSKTGINPKTYVFEKYKIDSTQYTQSTLYYSSSIDTYKEIVEKVRNRIEIEYKELDATYKIEKRIQDSTRTEKEKHLAAERDSLRKLNYHIQE